MAGAGVRLFTAGSILTAQQVNEYLMDQTVCVFNDSSARDAAFGGVGEPVLSEGRLAYLKSDDTLYVYTGSVWTEVQSGIPGTAGQVVVYNSSGDPTAQTFTGDVTVNSSAVTAIASGVIVNADINASAAIALSKLASGTASQIVVHNASGVPTATTVTGDVTITSAGVTAIGSGVVVDADINASAGIAHSKLANITAGNLLLGNSSNVPTSTAVTGDVTITSSGVTAIGSGVIVNADISSSASITHSKLANITAGSILMGNASNVPTATAVTGDVTIDSSGVTSIASGAIVNADVNASAAIALSKLASGTAGQLVVHNASGVPTATTVTGDVTITSSGVTAISSGAVVDADINASAAIAHSKLANATAGQVLLGTTTTGVVTATTVSGDVTITGAGVTSIGSGVIVNADINANAAIEISKIADVTIDTKTANYTLALTDKNKFIEMNLSSANTVSVPTNGSVAFPVGSQIHITQYGTGKTQIVAVTPATTTIRSTPGTYLRAQYSSATLIKRATDEWYLVGDLSAT